jgi:SAM-dependent methyltransferase
MVSRRYFGTDTPEEIERDRLEQLERVCDPVTTNRLMRLGVGPGWKCLEVGAGRGSVARWLADRVGPEGHVVATDLDTRFLKDPSEKNIEVREHDVLERPFEPNTFDLVHARALLMNLPEPKQALERMAQAVKPGGYLCIEDVDWSTLSAVDLDHPAAYEFGRLSRAGFDAVRAAGVSDGYFGRRIQGLVEGLGFDQTDGDGVVQIGRGGDHVAGRLQLLNLKLPMVKILLTKGIMTDPEYESLSALYQDPAFAFIGFTLFGAWGRKPV